MVDYNDNMNGYLNNNINGNYGVQTGPENNNFNLGNGKIINIG